MASVNQHWFTRTNTIEQVCGVSAEDEVRVIVRGYSYFFVQKISGNFPSAFSSPISSLGNEKTT